MEDSRVESDVRRLAELLEQVIRLSKRSRRSLESDLGVGSSGVSKVLRGTVRLQVSHVLGILEALEIDPYDFFRVAYSRRRLAKSPVIEQLRALGAHGMEPLPGDGERPAFEERVRLVLLKLLADTQGAN